MDKVDTVSIHGDKDKNDQSITFRHHGDIVRENANDYYPLVTQQMKEIKDTRLPISEKDPRILSTDKDFKEEQTNDESLSRNNESSTESFNS